MLGLIPPLLRLMPPMLPLLAIRCTFCASLFPPSPLPPPPFPSCTSPFSCPPCLHHSVGDLLYLYGGVRSNFSSRAYPLLMYAPNQDAWLDDSSAAALAPGAASPSAAAGSASAASVRPLTMLAGAGEAAAWPRPGPAQGK